jgi:hypothetical protein
MSTARTARIAGLAYILPTAIVVFGEFAIRARLMVSGDIAATARNLMAHQQLFRTGIVCDLAYAFGVLALLAALYAILEPVNRFLALLAGCCRLAHAFLWIVMGLDLLHALRLLGNPDYARALGVDGMHAVARLNLSGFDAYYIGLPFFALGCGLSALLWLQSRLIPRPLAAFAVIASAWCLICAVVFLIEPHFSALVNDWWFDSPMALGELATGVWLLAKGVTARPAYPLPRSARPTEAALSADAPPPPPPSA